MHLAVSDLAVYRKRSEDLVTMIQNHPEIKRWEIIDEGFHSLNKYLIRSLTEVASTLEVEYSVHAPFSSINLAEADSKLRSMFIEFMRRSLERAYELGAKIWVFHPGRLTPFTYSFREEAWKAEIEALRILSEEGKSLGLAVAVENMIGQYEMFKSKEDARKIVEDVEDIEICLDLGHANISGDVGGLMLGLPRIGHLHAHDNKGVEDSHLAAGRGSIDWETVAKNLHELKYDKWVVAENYDIKDSLESLTYLRTLLA